LFCWYGFGLAAEATSPAAPNPFAKLEAFLMRHHLTRGIGARLVRPGKEQGELRG